MQAAFRVALSAAVLAWILPSPVGAQWKSGWTVQCAPTYGAPTTCIDVAARAAYEAGDNRVDDLADYMVEQLGAAGAWMESLGFPAPHLQSEGDSYRLLVSNQAEVSTSRKDELAAYTLEDGGTIQFIPGVPYPTSPALAREMAADATAVGRAQSASNLWTPAHELFHAVQAAIVGPEPLRPMMGPAWAWAREGAAEAVASAFGEGAGYAANGVAARMGPPDYSLPLSAEDDAYEKWHFWRSVGREIGSEEEVAYLRTLFESPVAENSVQWVHQGIAPVVDPHLGRYKGLYGLLPQMIARHANDKTLYGASVPETSLSLQGQRSREARGQTAGLATTAIELTVTIPPDVIAGLTIELDEASRGNPSLHLIVEEDRLDELESDSRNVYMTALSDVEEETFLIRVVNVAPEPQTSKSESYTVVMTLDELGSCGSETMMRAVDPRALSQAVAGSAPLMSAQEYETRHEDIDGLHPAPGRLSISGVGIRDGGLGCTDPLGTNPMFTEDGDALRARMMERFQSMTPEERRAAMMGGRADSTRAVLEQGVPGLDPDRMRRAGAMMAALMGPAGDALIQVYSPAAPAWQLGQVGLLGTWHLYRHFGLGGWDNNAAAVVTLRLPGTSPDALEEGEIYPAELLIPEGSSEVAIYSRWNGEWRDMEGDSRAFQGVIEELTAGPLTGSVTVSEITGAQIVGTFELSGDGKLDYQLRQFYYRDGELRGDQCVEGQQGNQCHQRSGPVSISGTFRAPAAVAVERPGRAISFTHQVGAGR